MSTKSAKKIFIEYCLNLYLVLVQLYINGSMHVRDTKFLFLLFFLFSVEDINPPTMSTNQKDTSG